jgi:putative SOS response-associated peptidase YedK
MKIRCFPKLSKLCLVDLHYSMAHGNAFAVLHREKASPGLIPYWCKDPKGGRKPINAKSETVDKLPMFRDAYQRRRCILPVDGFFEWKAIKGQKAKQPYAIAMKDGKPFGIGGLWEN